MKKILILLTVLLTINFTPVVTAKTFDNVGDENQYFGYVSNYSESYYSSLTGLYGTDFRAELNDVITDNFVWQNYNSSTRYTILPEADAVYGQEGMVYCIYSGQIFYAEDSTTAGPNGYMWNTEHVWAKSHGFPSTSQLPYSDYHHLRVAEKNTNSRRNNRFIGSVDGLDYNTDDFGNKYTTDTWEPRDSVKGDVARMLLYMDVRYDGEESTEIDLVLLDDYEFPDSVGAPHMGHLSTLLEWNKEDPVDDRERYRNDVIYSYQFNRNPFIDHPEYADMIWGEVVEDELLSEYFDEFVESIDSNITSDSQKELAIAYALYNKLTVSQQFLVTTYDILEGYLITYKNITSYSEDELEIIFDFYENLLLLDDILNGNFYYLESYL
ncbi:MAG: endonuclease [bacterium]